MNYIAESDFVTAPRSHRSHDYAGQRFGRWQILAYVGRRLRGGSAVWTARCECGAVKFVSPSVMQRNGKDGGAKGCGDCLPYPNHPTNFNDLAGRRFGRALPIRYVGRRKSIAEWECRCDCGTVFVTTSSNLLGKKTRSCGCVRREVNSVQHRTHGKSKTRLYYVWNSMKARCLNQKGAGYALYGGRGIKIHQPWADSFVAWLADVGEPPAGGKYHLDRIDNNGHYEPGNVRWLPAAASARNKTTNRVLELNGVRRCLTEWAEVIGVGMCALRNRIAAGWSVERALTTPPMGKSRCRSSSGEAAKS